AVVYRARRREMPTLRYARDRERVRGESNLRPASRYADRARSCQVPCTRRTTTDRAATSHRIRGRPPPLDLADGVSQPTEDDTRSITATAATRCESMPRHR